MNPTGKEVISTEIVEQIEKAGIIAVIIIDKVKHALPLGEALLEGGVNTIELTLRTPEALEAAKILKREFSDLSLGFGTVLTIDQLNAVVDAGADFAVAPGCNPKIISRAIDLNLSFAPGIMTPSDIEIAIELGCRVLKFFPAESTGGMQHLKSMSAPYQYLGLKFIPLGGINMENAAEYLRSPLITAVGGSWVAKRQLIQNKDWSTITKNAKEIRTLIKQIRNNQ